MAQRVGVRFFKGGAVRSELAAQSRDRSRRGPLSPQRVFGALTIAALALVLPYEATLATRIAVSAVTLSSLVGARILTSYAPREILDLARTLVDIVLAIVVAALVPVLWGAAMVAVACQLVAAIPHQTNRTTASLLGGILIAMAALGVIHDVQGWYLAPLALLALSPGFVVHCRRAEREAQLAYEEFDVLVDAAPVFFWEANVANSKLVSVAGNVEALLGYQPSELIGESAATIMTPDATSSFRELADAAISPEGVSRVSNLVHKDGRHITFRHLINWVDETRVRGVSSDITELAEAVGTIRYQAEHDALTGLSNRAVLLNHISDLLASGPESPFALMTLDLNGFKLINDTLGHPLGDKMLQVIASRLQDELPTADLVARLGGDEFAVVVDNVDRGAAIETARKVIALVERPMEIDRVALTVSSSVGLVLAPDHGDTTELLLRHADIAMYQAKEAGESLTVYETTPTDFSVERLELVAQIAPAIQAGEIELWVQPKFCMQTLGIVGFEGLARWRHPRRGVLAPGQFLDAVALAGEYHSFTDSMIAQAVGFAAACSERGYDIEVAVNLSSQSFFDLQLPVRLERDLADANVEPHRLLLEITESDILDQDGAHLEVFAAIEKLGVGLSIDDFGTGHSSLTRLRELPVTEVKLDRSFVASVASDSDALIIVQSVIHLASQLGHRTVAEGVENEEVAAQLRDMGCRAAQGYLWAKPMPFAAFIGFAEDWEPGLIADFGLVEPTPDVSGSASQVLARSRSPHL